jgi:hypothetical protein
MAFEILPPAVGFESASLLRTAVGPKRLMRALVFAQIAAVCARKVAKTTFVRFLALV